MRVASSTFSSSCGGGGSSSRITRAAVSSASRLVGIRAAPRKPRSSSPPARAITSIASSQFTSVISSLQMQLLHGLLEPGRADHGVNRGAGWGGVPEKLLNGPQVAPCGLQEERGRGMPEGVRVQSLDPCHVPRLADPLLNPGLTDGISAAARKRRWPDPLGRIRQRHPVFENAAELWVDWNDPLALPLAHKPEPCLLAVVLDIRPREHSTLGQPQAGVEKGVDHGIDHWAESGGDLEHHTSL